MRAGTVSVFYTVSLGHDTGSDKVLLKEYLYNEYRIHQTHFFQGYIFPFLLFFTGLYLPLFIFLN